MVLYKFYQFHHLELIKLKLMNGLGSKVPAQPEKTTGATGENNRIHRRKPPVATEHRILLGSVATGENHRSHRNLGESSESAGENHRSHRNFGLFFLGFSLSFY